MSDAYRKGAEGMPTVPPWVLTVSGKASNSSLGNEPDSTEVACGI